MTIELPNIKFEGNDLGALFSYFNAAWEDHEGEAIHRANAESEMAKRHDNLWKMFQREVHRIAQNAFEMGVAYGKANDEMRDAKGETKL